MAQDQVEVMAALGYDRFYAAGHDRGARVLHRMCLDHPEKVARAAILDIIPQHHLLNNVTQAWATFSWHWFFMIQPYDLPEQMMGADPDFFIEKKLAKTKQGLSFFDPEALAEYKRCFRNPATIHAMCEDYRAAAGIDLDMDTKDFEAGRKIACPVLLLWGATGGVGRNHKPSSGEIWQRYAAEYRRRQGAAVRVIICPRRRRRKPRALRRFFRAASPVVRAGHDTAFAIGAMASGAGRSDLPVAGSVRKFSIAYQNSCRFLLKPALCAVFGRMTNWRSPFGSCR